MTRVAPIVPAETDVLCEGCGYTLNGLPEAGNCPECGRPIGESVGTHRNLSRFEAWASPWSFVDTTAAVLLQPSKFYSSLRTRHDSIEAVVFANWHRLIAALMLGLAVWGHALFVLDGSFGLTAQLGIAFIVLIPLAGVVLAFLMLVGVAALAAWLSAIEARYWGMRLPQAIVKRALRFHSAAYLPVGILALAIVWGYRALVATNVVAISTAPYYLYTLCAAVILSAGYLFRMYWIAMKGMMYANR